VEAHDRWDEAAQYRRDVTHRLVLKRRLPAPFEDLQRYVSSESGLRYLKRKLTDVDPDLLRAATRLVQSGDVV